MTTFELLVLTLTPIFRNVRHIMLFEVLYLIATYMYVCVISGVHAMTVMELLDLTGYTSLQV